MGRTVTEARWIELDGAANVRDLAGLPTEDGRAIAPHRLIRSDNLQTLSERDVRLLVDEIGVRAVADLRTTAEVDLEGPGPLLRVPQVEVVHLSLFPERGQNTDVAVEDDAPTLLPWEDEQWRAERRSRARAGVAGIYLDYLRDRADSVVDALRLIAHSPGATIVHCAAGKDRTGTVVALTLSEVGVTREAIVADYARTGERIEQVIGRLVASPTYARDVQRTEPGAHAPRAATMEELLDRVDAEFGGVAAWLRRHGWTSEDADALRTKLLPAA